jgi:hypothetical protein
MKVKRQLSEAWMQLISQFYATCDGPIIRGPFQGFVDWRQCAAIMQMEAATLCQVVVVGVT